MKRHTKPYGCTDPRCRKRFGSKNDWKRHEISQHFQQEMWRCSYDDCSSATPAQLFYDRELFVKHIKKEHENESHALDDEKVDAVHVAHDFQGSFWCGFCKEIKPSPFQLDIDVHTQRFDHIGKHFDDPENSANIIEDWICLEMNKPMREIWKKVPDRLKENTQSRRNSHDEPSQPRKRSRNDLPGDDDGGSSGGAPRKQSRTNCVQGTGCC